MAVVWFLGDSVTEVNYMSASLRWVDRIGASIGVDVVNYGDSGKTTADFLTGGSNRAWFTTTPLPDFVCFSFGYNDEDVITSAQFLIASRALIADVESLGAHPVMITQPTVDYPDHALTNPNPTIIDFNDQYKTINTVDGKQLIDYAANIQTKIDGGDWDWRIRRYVELTPPDNVATNPDVWDATLDSVMIPLIGEPLWNENIHGNTRDQIERAAFIGAALVAVLSNITWADVVVVAPNLATPVVGFQTLILAYVNEHVLVGTEASEKTDMARRYLAAHMAEMTMSGSSVSGGVVTSEKVDDLERQYAGASLAGTDPNLDATTYGKMYKYIVRNSVARFVLL